MGVAISLYIEVDTGGPEKKQIELYETGMTYNLSQMLAEANIKQLLWYPDEIGIEYAGEMIKFLEKGIDLLKSDPERFEKLNPKNGWGSYKNILNVLEEYLVACRKHPKAKISIWR